MPAIPAPITHTSTRVPAASGARSGVAKLIQGERDFTCIVMARLQGGVAVGPAAASGVSTKPYWTPACGKMAAPDGGTALVRWNQPSTRPDKASWTFRSQEE